MSDLTRKQLQQQDRFDNAITSLLNSQVSEKYRFDDLVGNIRQLIIDHCCEDGLNLIAEMDLYPYLIEPADEPEDPERDWRGDGEDPWRDEDPII